MKTLAALAMLVGAFSFNANVALAGASDYPYVTKVNVGTDNYAYIAVRGNYANSGCSKPWYARTSHTLTDERAKAQMQVALSSFLSKKEVYIWTNGCTSYGYPILTKIQLQQD